MNETKNISTFIKSSLSFVLIALFVFASSPSFAQGFEKFYGNDDADESHAVVQTTDGGFAMVGYTEFDELEVIRTDQNGNIEWVKTFGDVVATEVANDIIETADQGFVIVGTDGLGVVAERDIILFKIDKNGELLWQKHYGLTTEPGEGLNNGYSVQQTIDGGYVIAGVAPIGDNNTDAFLIKTDVDGDEQWSRTFGGPFNDVAHAAIQTADGGFIVAGQIETVENDDRDFFVVKTNSLGFEVWSNNYNQDVVDVANDVIELPNGNIICAGASGPNGMLLQIDPLGNIPIWYSFPNGLSNSFEAIAATADGNFIMTGLVEIEVNESKVLLVKADQNGNQLWAKDFGRMSDGSSLLISKGFDVNNTIDGGYIVSGYSSKSNNFLDTDSYLIKTNSEGEIYTNYIEGTIFDDINQNCIHDSNEPILEDWVVEAKGDQSFYGTTDANGKYSILVANGTYDVTMLKPSDYVQGCVNSYNITLNGVNDTVSFLFPVQEIESCPAMEVGISTALLEKCHYSDYVVNYANRGTDVAVNAEVKVNLDEFLIFNSAELPFTNEIIDGDLYYVFNIGNVAPLETGSFKINVLVDCVAPQLNQTHCVTALIFPDTICQPINPLWDGSSLEVTGVCDADSVRFNIINTGDDMDSERNWIVIEDEVMLFQEPGTVILPANEFEPMAFEANGSTYRILVEQSEFHPGSSIPTVAVEGCVPDNSEFETGYFTMFPEDDNDKSKSIDCQENVDADDVPDNHINAYPKGYDDEHYITNTTEINYHIRFQNTDIDTVDRVIIRDTLSDFFDISTVELGASSHDFTFEIYDERILKFTFDNIMLPDSSTNEAASNGFVKFRVSQKLDNQPGTIIYNCAAIYFDFDAPIKTNETFHTIGEGDWQDFVTVSTTNVFLPDVNINVFPNPFMESATFQMSGMDFRDLEFKIYDMQGRLMRSEIHNGNEFEFHRNQLSSGLYVYRIESEGTPVAVGKIVIE